MDRNDHENDVSQPLLAISRENYDHTSQSNISDRQLRESYVEQLGYTPLILSKVKRFSNYLASYSPMGRFHKTRDEAKRAASISDSTIDTDTFPYHQSIIPSKGSIRGSIFNLAGATLGAGALSLPYACAVSGLTFAIAQLILAAWLTIYTIRLLMRAGDLTDLRSYEDIAMYCFGKRMALFVEVNILVFCFGISVAYLVTLGDILTPLGEVVFGMESYFSQRWVLMTFSCAIVMFPLSLLRDISSLQLSSILGVISILFLVLAVCIRSIMHMEEYGVPEHISYGLNVQNFPSFLLSIPIVMFAFTNQVNVFSIFTELQRPCIRRMDKVVTRSTYISFTVYAVIGIIAYLAFGPSLLLKEMKGNILLSFPLSDKLIALSRAAITFTVAVAFPLNIFPCRFTLEIMFFADAKAESPIRHVVLTSLLVGSALYLAIFCPSINVIFGVIGGTCSSIVCFCIPSAFILKLEKGSVFGRKKIGPLLLLIGAIILGVVGTGVTIWSNFVQ